MGRVYRNRLAGQAFMARPLPVFRANGFGKVADRVSLGRGRFYDTKILLSPYSSNAGGIHSQSKSKIEIRQMDRWF